MFLQRKNMMIYNVKCIYVYNVDTCTFKTQEHDMGFYIEPRSKYGTFIVH